MEKHILSKSTFLKGCQCTKALYLSKHNRALREEPDAAVAQIFTLGKKVGELAGQLFPGGVDCTPVSVFRFSGSCGEDEGGDCEGNESDLRSGVSI